jgi:GTP:adenosylcobinamide-phosphate guanylyltransferase
MTVVSAVILAGSRPEGDPLAQTLDVAAKALIEIGGKPMLARVISALRNAGLQRIVVSASAPEVVALTTYLGGEVISASAGPSASAAQAFQLVGAPMLLTTADHAMLEPAWVRHFLSVRPVKADVSVMLARRETIERDAPNTRRSYLHFADGDWSGCNLFYFATPAAGAAFDLWQSIEADRKRPWRIAARLGPSMLIRHALRRFSAAETIAHLGKRAGLHAGLVESPFGLAAVDVDKPDDLALVRELTDSSPNPYETEYDKHAETQRPNQYAHTGAHGSKSGE